MIRKCSDTCPLRLQCRTVREKIPELSGEIDATEEETVRLLNLGSTLLAEAKLARDFDAEQHILDIIDNQLDTFTSAQLNKQKMQELKKLWWAPTVLSKLAVATCIGPIKGHCSSPVGFILLA